MKVVLYKYHVHGILYWLQRLCKQEQGLTDPTIAEVKFCFVLMAFMIHGEVSTKSYLEPKLR